jgi:hypothetical protein
VLALPVPDRAVEFERLLAPTDPARMRALYRSAGLDTDDQGSSVWFPERLARLQDRLPLLVAEARRLAQRYGALLREDRTGMLVFQQFGWYGVDLRVRRDATRIVAAGEWPSTSDHVGPVSFGIAAPRDAALLRWGVLTPDQLHPLVHEALFPGRTQDWQPILHDPYSTFRVRCGTAWHLIEAVGASVRTPHHDEAELHRQEALRAPGELPGGCAAAISGFRTGGRRVPKEVRKLRQRIFARAFHGDTDAVLADLSAGFDPRLRDGQGRSLMHLVAHLDHERVLPVLLAAGVPLDDQDHDGRTPLHVAALSATEDVMAALIAAGARENVPDSGGRTAAALLAARKKVRQG